jgi:hypothetical protein
MPLLAGDGVAASEICTVMDRVDEETLERIGLVTGALFDGLRNTVIRARLGGRPVRLRVDESGCVHLDVRPEDTRLPR